MHADGAVHAVVENNHHNRQLVLCGGGEFLPVHHKAAVAGKADHFALGVLVFGGHGGGQAVAHGAGCGRQLGAEAAVAVEAVQPGGVITGAVGDDGIGGQLRLQGADDVGRIHFAAHLHRAGVGPRQVILAALCQPVGMVGFHFGVGGQAVGQVSGGGVDGHIGGIHAVQLQHIRVDVHHFFGCAAIE